MGTTASAMFAAAARGWILRVIRPIRTAVALAMVGGCLGYATMLPATAATPDQFVARTTADFVALCSADPAEENYVAAVHFCHGFATGAYQYHQSLAAASEADRFVCPPDPPPSRSQAIADFVAWAERNPQYMSERPVESIFRHLAERYPCGQ